MAQATRAELEQRIEEQDERIARLQEDLLQMTGDRNDWRTVTRYVLHQTTPGK